MIQIKYNGKYTVRYSSADVVIYGNNDGNDKCNNNRNLLRKAFLPIRFVCI